MYVREALSYCYLHSYFCLKRMFLGNIHVLRKHKGGREGGGQPNAYVCLQHTVSSQDFRSLSVFLILLSKFVDVLMTLGKNSLNSESLEVKVAISRKNFLKKFRKKIFLSKFCFIFF